MSECCDICGLRASESGTFAVEQIPFRRKKRYCASCHSRYRQRVYLVVSVTCIGIGFIGVLLGARTHKSFLHRPGVWGACFFVAQILMVLPHELGHAILARLWRCESIRIFIGFGRPLFSIRWLGFTWIFNAMPVGGLTLWRQGKELSRSKRISIVAAGPLINLALAGGITLFGSSVGFFGHIRTWPSILFWANIFVFICSLLPASVQTAAGPTQTDGLQLWNLVFRWNKPAPSQSENVPSWELFLCHVLKWLVVSITGGVAVLMAYWAAKLLGGWLGMEVLYDRVIPAVVLFAGCGLVAWFSIHFALKPVSKLRNHRPKPRLRFTPEQKVLWEKINDSTAAENYVEAERVYDQLITTVADKDSPTFVRILLGRMVVQLKLGEVERAEKTCLDFVHENVSNESKVMLLDGFVCLVLYGASSPWLERAERMARLTLEMAPQRLTLKGTLGGILAEKGDFAEAEALLRECLERSPDFHDQGISSFYLGVVRLGQGRLAEAKRLINTGIALYPEDWMLAKAKVRLMLIPD
jgi:tetratricopeptide (TPR) repeat protein